MIHVCFAIYDADGRYSKFTGTAITSLFENTIAQVTAHILHDDTLTENNRDKFTFLAVKYNQRIKFHNVTKLAATAEPAIKELFSHAKNFHYSVAAVYRLLLTEILSPDIEKIIYLDSDIVVNLDIAELWQIELGDKILAGVPEIESAFDKTREMQKFFPLCRDNFVRCEDYFNSGVLIMNLKLLRGEGETLTAGIKFINKNPQYINYLDQDILNYCFSTRTLKLPTKFNRFTRNFRFENEKFIGRKIYHYTGSNINYGLGLDPKDPVNRLWMNYFAKTPFFGAETIGHLYEKVEELHDGCKTALRNLSAIMSGRTRTFFIRASDLDFVREIFSVRDDEEIIFADNDAGVEKFFAEMKSSGDKKIFFVVIPNFPFEILTENGFVHSRDFLNGLEFLSAEQGGVSFNAYKFLRGM